MSTTKLTADQVAALRLDHERGASQNELASRYGIRQSSVWYHLHSRPAHEGQPKPRVATPGPSPTWTVHGACCGDPNPDLWYEDTKTDLKNHGKQHPAIKICRSCPVRDECLRYALSLTNEQDWGIWGGLTSRERHKIRRRRAARSARSTR